MNKTQKSLRCQKAFAVLWALCLGLVLLGGCSSAGDAADRVDTSTASGVLSSSEAAREYALDEDDFALRPTRSSQTESADGIPLYAGVDVIELNGNMPEFTDVEKDYAPFEFYGDLDDLGRCTVAFALTGPETMPTEKRGDIREVYPSGWKQAFYDFVDQEALFNRTHLIGYMLTAENANECNLITGTRHMNAEVMLSYEEAVANYINETGNHVLYRVTPYFVGDELVARGIQMEAYSVEDEGAGICFNIFCYNVEPGVAIDYATGDSWLADEDDLSKVSGSGVNDSKRAKDASGSYAETPSNDQTAASQAKPNTADSERETEESTTIASDQARVAYVLNTKARKFHEPDCSSVGDIAPDNRQDYEGTREDLIDLGYSPCGNCKP